MALRIRQRSPRIPKNRKLRNKKKKAAARSDGKAFRGRIVHRLFSVSQEGNCFKVGKHTALSVIAFCQRRMNILYGPKNVMGTGKADAGTVLDPVVNLFQVIGGLAADLQEKVKFSGKIVTRNDIGIFIHLLDKIIIIPGMFHTDLH